MPSQEWLFLVKNNETTELNREMCLGLAQNACGYLGSSRNQEGIRTSVIFLQSCLWTHPGETGSCIPRFPFFFVACL